jgi:hypothetical protein
MIEKRRAMHALGLRLFFGGPSAPAVNDDSNSVPDRGPNHGESIGPNRTGIGRHGIPRDRQWFGSVGG